MPKTTTAAPPKTSLLQRELAQSRPFTSPHEEAFLALQRTASILQKASAVDLRRAHLTGTQYNVLRILKGARPDALTCGQIGARMVTPAPDVTRVVDRLIRRGLAVRHRDADDRRVVLVAIDDQGITLLDALQEPVVARLRTLMGVLSEPELGQLIDLLARLRGPL